MVLQFITILSFPFLSFHPYRRLCPLLPSSDNPIFLCNSSQFSHFLFFPCILIFLCKVLKAYESFSDSAMLGYRANFSFNLEQSRVKLIVNVCHVQSDRRVAVRLCLFQLKTSDFCSPPIKKAIRKRLGDKCAARVLSL